MSEKTQDIYGDNSIIQRLIPLAELLQVYQLDDSYKD